MNDNIQIPVTGENETPSMLSKSAVGLEDLGRIKAEAAAESAAAARNALERKEAPRGRRSNLGGPTMKLEVFNAVIPGWHLYWENDADARVERLLQNGFDFVTQEEAGMVRVAHRVVPDGDLDNRVSKFVGTTDDGKAMRAYLMKCPDEIWEDIQHCINDLADSRDRDILDSASRASDDRYQPKGYETKVVSGMRR